MLYKYITILILCLFIGCSKGDRVARKNIGHFVKNKVTEEIGFVIGYDFIDNMYKVKFKDEHISYWYKVEVENLPEQE